MSMFSVLQQSFLIPAPPLTEANIGSLAGKVCLVTGGNSGVGLELVKILYGASATVLVAGRNAAACADAIERVRAAHPASKGRLDFVKLDLADLSTIKASAQDVLARVDRLHFLCNNAAVMEPPAGSVAAQGHELQLATNCLGPYVFTELLRPLLVKTAKEEREKGIENSVRVAWAGSAGIDTYSPNGGVSFIKGEGGLEEQKVLGPRPDYGQSKTGNLFLAKAWGDEVKKDGIVSTCFNPGNLSTNLTRHVEKDMSGLIFWILQKILLYPSIYGAYTELYCGFGHDLTTADNGIYVAPWGRKWYVRSDIEKARTGEICSRYMDLVRRETKAYL